MVFFLCCYVASHPVHYSPKKRHQWPPLSYSFVMQCSQNISILFSTGSQRWAPPTFSHRFDSDNFTGVSTTCSGDSYHPDTVLTVPAQVGDAVEEDIWGCLELAAHLSGRGYVQNSHYLQIIFTINITHWLCIKNEIELMISLTFFSSEQIPQKKSRKLILTV